MTIFLDGHPKSFFVFLSYQDITCFYILSEPDDFFIGMLIIKELRSPTSSGMQAMPKTCGRNIYSTNDTRFALFTYL